MARTAAVTGATPGASRAPRTLPASDRTDKSFRRGASEGSERAAGGRKGGRGFNAWNKSVKESRDFSTFQVPADQVKVIAFLETENYGMVFRHWVPTVTDDGRTVNVPRNCIEDPDADVPVRCPLCDLGDEPKPVALFNIVDLDEPAKAQLWEAGKEVMKRVEELFGELQDVPEDRGGPLELNSPGVYAAVSRKKKSNGYWEYKVARVKERDLDEDHGLDPLTEEQFEAALTKLNTMDDLKFNTVQELRDLAATLSD